MEDNKYINIFNQGYLLQKHNPELLEKLLSTMDQRSTYLGALKDGSLQLQLERGKEVKKAQGKDFTIEDLIKKKDKSQSKEHLDKSMDQDLDRD